jgi:hypothetical protein
MRICGTRRFRGRTCIQEEDFRFESTTLTNSSYGPEIPDPDFAIRGVFSTYVGLDNTTHLPSGTFIDVHVPNFNWQNMDNYFKVRRSSFQSYKAITDKYDLSTLLKNISKDFWTTV